MFRTTMLALAGAVAGAVLTRLLLVGTAAPSSAGFEPLHEHVAPPPATATTRPAEAASLRLAVVAAAAEISDPAEIEARLAALLAGPYSRETRIEIEALFARLAALDLGRALRVATRLELDRGLVSRVFHAWSTRDAEAAIAALGAIGNRAVRIAAALGVADALGNSAAGLERVAASLPTADHLRLHALALENLAKSNPDAALDRALSLGDSAVRNTAVQRIGVEWVHRDPEAAFSRTALLPAELRDGYRDSVTTEWARIHTANYLDFLDRQQNLAPQLLGIGHAMTYDPARLFEIAERHKPVAFYGLGTVEAVAFNVVAQVDFDWALAYLDTIQDDNRAMTLTTVLAQTYGRDDPDKALAWARSFEPPRPDLEAAVIGQIAAVDLDKSLRLIRDFDPEPTTAAIPAGRATADYIAQYIGNFAANDPRREEIASALLARQDDPSAAAILQQVTSRWVQTDPRSALDWMLENETAVEPQFVSTIGLTLAVRDPRRAAEYLDRIPPELKRTWMEQVAAPYARFDPAGAARWIVGLQGEPGYESALAQIVAQTAQSNPDSAALMLASAPADVQRNAAPGVAAAWARQDLPSAARWALQLADDDTRLAAVDNVANTWATRDPSAAQRWAAGLPRGRARDRALTTVLRGVLRGGADLERNFGEAFESRLQLQQQIVAQLGSVASGDPDRAAALLDGWVAEGPLRTQGESIVAAARHRYGL